LAVWLGGAMILLFVYTLRCYLFLKRIKQDGQTAIAADEFPAVDRAVRRLSRYVGLRRTPRVVLSSNNVGPAVFGLFRPTVILPTALVERKTTRELAPIVLHELMHIRRGDLWLTLHSVLVRAIWWFHPLVWWSVRRAEWESERCCDESVVACMRRSPARYAHSLINALELCHQLRSSSLVPGVRPVDITAKRLERIMKLGQGSHRRMPVGCWALAILAAALILPGAAGGLAQSPEAQGQTKDAMVFRVPGRIDAIETTVEHDPLVQQASHVVGVDNREIEKSTLPPIAKIYVVADLLAKMKREEYANDDVTDEQLKQSLVNHLKYFPPDLHMILGSADKQARLLEQQTHFGWSGDQLVVSGPEEVHERLVKEIEFRRKHSFHQVTIEVRIMRGSPSLCAHGEGAGAKTPDDGIEFWRNRWILFQQEFATAEPAMNSQQSTSIEFGNDDQLQTSSRPSASVTTGKSDPIVYQFLDDELMRAFIDYSNENERNNISMAPKITLFDGQSAEISDCSQRPFVTDVTQVVGPTAVAYQPVIQVLWEGTKIQLAPTITPDGHRLKCRFRFASIDDCKTFRPARYPDAKGLVVQHPVVSTASLECAIDIPAGETLLIGGLFPQETERTEKQSAIGRLLGRQPTKITREEMTYIAITPRTITADDSPK
jgi:beta-lactamase regulating signal transducer with metallopeptidase domain